MAVTMSYADFLLILITCTERASIWPETEAAPLYLCSGQLLISKVRLPISLRNAPAKAFSDKPN